jgi:hypothetical protein
MAEGSLLSSGETIPADPMDLFPRIEGEGWDSAHVGPSQKYQFFREFMGDSRGDSGSRRIARPVRQKRAEI